MITLRFDREPRWITLSGADILVRPATAALVMAAQAETAQHPVAEERPAIMLRSVARRAIIDWKGIGDADGNPIPVSDEAINALFDLWVIAVAFERDYLGPALDVDREKNVSAPVASGISAAANPIADPALTPMPTAPAGETVPSANTDGTNP